MSDARVAAAQPPRSGTVLIPLLAGAAVAVALGVYSNVHDPTGRQLYTLVFTRTINLKIWFATGALALGVFQVVSALRMYGQIGVPRRVPAWFGDAHRLSGTVAFLLTLPVAFHCLWALGYQDLQTRTMVHSVTGCVFYGIFVAKVIAVRRHDLPGWFLPAMGGLTFATLVVAWYTSAVWFWATIEDFPAF